MKPIIPIILATLVPATSLTAQSSPAMRPAPIRIAPANGHMNANPGGADGRDLAMMRAMQTQIDELTTRLDNQAKTIAALQTALQGVSQGGIAKVTSLQASLDALRQDFKGHTHLISEHFPVPNKPFNMAVESTSVPMQFCKALGVTYGGGAAC